MVILGFLLLVTELGGVITGALKEYLVGTKLRLLLAFIFLFNFSAFAENKTLEEDTDWSVFFFSEPVVVEPLCGDCYNSVSNDFYIKRCWVPSWGQGQFFADGYIWNGEEFITGAEYRVWHWFDWKTDIRFCK